MATSILEARGGCIIPQADQRGYHIVYREHETNYCPGCGRTHWYIGRLSAECGFCGTALPLAEAYVQSSAGGHSRNWKPFEPSELAA